MLDDTGDVYEAVMMWETSHVEFRDMLADWSYLCGSVGVVYGPRWASDAPRTVLE